MIYARSSCGFCDLRLTTLSHLFSGTSGALGTKCGRGRCSGFQKVDPTV